MERFSIILFSLCFLAIQAESTPAGSLTTIETLLDNARDIRDVENHADLLKSKNVQNNTKQLLINENPMKAATQIEEEAKDPSYLKAANASATSTSNFSSNYIKDTQHSRHNGDREGDAYHKEGSSVDLSSHDILLDPGLISARLSRQAETGDMNSTLASKNLSRDIESNNHNKNHGNIVPSKRKSNLKDDLGVAEDRYPPYPYWNPYYYRGQFPNQGYRANDRREPYNNYWRYPVFPGK